MAEVGCAGLLVEDCFCGPLTALPPEGGLLVLEDIPERAGGCAANVAIDLARQGISVDVAGCIGKDFAANILLDAFERHKVGTDRVTVADSFRTSRTVILLIEGQDRRYLHYPGANRAFTIDQISRGWLSELRAFYLGGLFALPGINLDQLRSLLEFCRSKNVLTIVDVVAPQEEGGMKHLESLLPVIDVFVPNDDEAAAFTGLSDPLDQVKALEAAGGSTVIVTRGAQGCVARHGGLTYHCGAYHMSVVDPSGSGDAFTAGLIRGLLARWDMPHTLRYASAVGASATRATGTTDSVFSSQEAEQFVLTHPLHVSENS